MVQNLHRTTRRFKRNVQSDPHELFLEIVNSFPKSWKQLFKGTLESELECPRKHVHKVQESFLNISLDVPNAFGRSRKSNQILLRNLVKKFIHTKENIFGFKCSNCGGQPGRVVRKYSFHELPEILVFHLKLFDSMARKKNSQVGFDEILKIGGEEYEVVSLVEHRGRGIHFGHYVSYCRRSDGIWVLLNDSRVSTVARRELLTRVKPYMIVYKKVRKRRGKLVEHSRKAAVVEFEQESQWQSNGDSGRIEQNIEEIFSKGKKKETRDLPENSKIEIEEPEPKCGDSHLKSLEKLKETSQYREYMRQFSEVNRAILKEKEDMRAETFCYNGKVFRVEELLQNGFNSRKRQITKRANFVGLSKKFGRLSKMRRILRNLNLEISNRKQRNPKIQTNNPKNTKQVTEYLNKIRAENSKDFQSVQVRKNSYDAEYDKGKTKKIKKKQKRKQKKLNFQKEYLNRLAQFSN